MYTRDRGMLCVLMFCSIGILDIPAAFAQIENLEPPVTISDPVGPYFADVEGTGLCMLTAFSQDLANDFGNADSTYWSNANTFFEARRGVANGTIPERVVRTVLDLANQPTVGDPSGDFVNTEPDCPGPGCAFFPPVCPPDWAPVNAQGVCDNGMSPVTPEEPGGTYGAWGSRLRGFLNVPPEWVGRYVYFGLYADAGSAIVLFNSSGVPHVVNVRPIEFGVDAWITTNTVVFEESGIYPIEFIYTNVGGIAILEASYLLGDDDTRRNEDNVLTWMEPSFQEQGYVLLSESAFFQTLTGTPSFESVDECQQCARQFVNVPGGDECDSGYYCNEAALCAPCNTPRFCGLACLPCGGTTPFCGDPGDGYQCVECLVDEDCQEGFTCNPDTLTCAECNVDDDCERGDYCVDNACVPCDTSDSCAGNSCNCCPTGADGVQLQCAPLDQGGDPVCVECASDADCAAGVCDIQIGRCVDRLPDNERADCCGPNCAVCPGDHPFCLPGPLGTSCAECRWDTDCGDGLYCQSGECLPCTHDRRCGGRCESCGDDTPFCKAGQMPELSVCVACERDADCASGACDLASNTCAQPSSCASSCGEDTPYCFGDACVECFADTHCPCNGVCDLSNNTCLSSCTGNDDCMGYEHCAQDFDTEEKVCKVGPSVVQSPCGALATSCVAFSCSVAPAGRAPGRYPLGALLLGFISLVLLGRTRRRCRGGVS